MRAEDWPEVAAIYAQGIASGTATFETAVPPYAAWDAAHLPDHRLVAREGDTVIGWAALSPYSERAVYRGVAEDTIYVAAHARGRGIGLELLSRLIERAESAGIWTLQAAMFPENAASAALHERCGFRAVGTRERLAKLHGVWRDVLLMERRSGLE